MECDADGVYRKQIRCDKREKLVFKFISDGGKWLVSDKYGIERDSSGIENNYVDAVDLRAIEEFEEGAKTELDAIEATAEPLRDSLLNENHLSQVITSSSSYASVSIPEGQNIDGRSSFENASASSMAFINKDEDELDVSVNEGHVPSTTNTSIVNLNTDANPHPSDTLSGQPIAVKESSTSKDGIFSKVPGSFPLDNESSRNSTIEVNTSETSSRREGLMSRIKSMFRYL